MAMATLIIPRFLALRFILCAATSVEPEPEPMDGYTTSGEPEPEPAMTTTMALEMERVQTFTHRITMTSLSEFSDVAALEARYKESMVNTTGATERAVSVSLTRIVVKVISTINGVTSDQLERVREAFAAIANVLLTAVDVEVIGGGRRLEATAERRRLNSMQVAGNITVEAGNIVQDAQDISTRIQNDTALGAEIANRTGATVTVQSSTSFQLTISANVSSDSTLDPSTIEAAVGQGLNGTAETVYFYDGYTSSSESSTTSGAISGSGAMTCKGHALPRPTDDITWTCKIDYHDPDSYMVALHHVDSAKKDYLCSPQCKAPQVVEPSTFEARCSWNGSWITSETAKLSCVTTTASGNDYDSAQRSLASILISCVVIIFACLRL